MNDRAEGRSPAEAPHVIAPERIRCDALFLANAVESPGGLLYVLGGAWMRTWPTGGTYPYERPIPIVCILRVPYHDANSDHGFVISVRDSDERELVRADGAFKLGRDVDLTQGMSQLVPIAMTPLVQLEAPGINYIALSVDGEELHRIAFEALARAPRQSR